MFEEVLMAKIIKSIKLEPKSLINIKKIHSVLKASESEHAFLVRAIDNQIFIDAKEHNISLFEDLFFPKDECLITGFYNAIFYDFSNCEMDSLTGDLESTYKLGKGSDNNFSDDNSISSNPLRTEFLTEYNVGSKKIRKIIYVNKGEKFPNFENVKKCNCYELLTNGELTSTYKIDM